MNEAIDVADPELAAMRAPKCPHSVDYLALAAGALPFVLSFRETHTESITFDGSVDPKAVAELSAKASHTEYKDAAAIGGGAVAVVLALVTLAFWRSTQREKRAMRIGLTLVILALGAYQLIVRGGLLT